MNPPVSNRVVVWTLTALLAFGALSAAVGAVLAIAANGAGVPLEYLKNSPFSSFFIPGLILGVVVGGTQLAAAIALLAKRDIALLLSAIAGFGMLIWIFVELALMQQFSWLQAAYFILGGLELVLVLALLGIKFYLTKKSYFKAWFASALTIVLCTFFGVVGLFPNLFPSSLNPEYSLSAYNASSSPLTLKIMLIVTVIFIPVVIAYQVWTYNLFKGKVTKADLAYEEDAAY